MLRGDILNLGRLNSRKTLVSYAGYGMIKVSLQNRQKMKKNKQTSRSILFGRLMSPVITVVLVFSMLAGAAVLVSAQSSESYQNQIDELRQQNQQNQSSVDKLRNVATSYEDAIEQLEDDIKDKEYELNASKNKQTELEVAIKKAQAELEKQKELLGTNIRAMYIEGDITTLEMLASSNNLSEFVDKQQYRESIKNQITSTVEKVTSLQNELKEQKTQVEEEITIQKTRRAELASNRAEQSRLLALNESEQAQFNAQTAKNKDKIKELEEAQAALQRRLSSGSFVSQGPVKRGDILGTVGNTGFSFGAHLHLEARNSSGGVFNPAPLITSGQWLRPVEGGYVSQGYGVANPIYVRGWHPGIDYAGVTNRPVRAVADGDIVSRGWVTFGTSAYGFAVVIRHYDGTFSVYGHMNPP